MGGVGMRKPPLGDFLNRLEAADLLRVSPHTLDTMRKDGRLTRGVHWFQPPRTRPIYSRKALEDWVHADADVVAVTRLPRSSASPINEALVD